MVPDSIRDLSKYFDTIPHGQLMQSVARRIPGSSPGTDRDVLRLIKLWLKAPVEETDGDGKRRMSGGKRSTSGTPQGGVISPLLANLHMNRFLKYWRITGQAERLHGHVISGACPRAGRRPDPGADDFVILSRGHAAEALTWTRTVMGRLGLSLNEAKTCVRQARTESFDFLGYTFGPHVHRKHGYRYLGASPSKKSVARLKRKVGEELRPGNQAPWPVVRDRLNSMLDGWSRYFGHGTRLIAYRTVDNYVYERVRGFLVRRHKVSSRGTTRFPGGAVPGSEPGARFGELGVLRSRRVHLGPPPPDQVRGGLRALR